jgi:hypothetical protein
MDTLRLAIPISLSVSDMLTLFFSKKKKKKKKSAVRAISMESGVRIVHLDRKSSLAVVSNYAAQVRTNVH